MKTHAIITRGLLASVLLCLAATTINAAPRTSTAPPAQHFILRVNWGSSDSGGTESVMEIYGWSHEIVSPRDAASGLPTGKRQHKPFTITKVLDKATPLFLQSLVANKVIPSAELIVVQTGSDGKEAPVFTIRLRQATVVGSKTSGGTDDNEVATEQVTFVYEGIEWNSLDGGTTATDSWEDQT